MEEAFTKIVSQILNNWTALKLAVDHSMGGPHSKQVSPTVYTLNHPLTAPFRSQ